MTHCKAPRRKCAVKSSAPSNGSALTNFTGAGSRSSTSMRGAYFWLSTDTPIQMCGGHSLLNQPAISVCHQPTALPGRLVST